MTLTRKDWYLEERPRALAVVLLTERDDLEIAAVADRDVHFLVTLGKPGSAPLRRFGIALDARVKPVSLAELKKLLSAKFRSQTEGASEPSYPVCLFYFTMQDNGAYYSWIVEPRVSEDGRPRPLSRADGECEVLDRAALDAVVDAVDRWYAACEAGSAANVG